jgi:Zn-dependent protease with chaperone function
LTTLSLYSGASALAQDELETYLNNLLNKLNEEISAINSFVSAYESADFTSQYSLSQFQTALLTHKKSFDGFLTFYRSPLPTGASNDLIEIVSLANSGTEKILNGIAAIDKAITNLSDVQLQAGEGLVNEGISLMRSASDKYDTFATSYNSQASNSESTSSNDFGLGASFRTTVRFGEPLLALYVYLLIAGFALSYSFKTRLRDLVNGKTKGQEFRGTGLYGFHLIILLPFLYVLLAFCLLLILDFTLAGVWVISNWINIGLILGLIVVIVGSIWAIFKGFFGSKERNILGVPLSTEKHPRIWELCSAVSKEVGTKNVDEIILSPQPGIGVHLSGGLLNLLIGRTKRTLTIGMASVSNLSISQMEAILAHEFGHFSNKDTSWNSLTFTMSATLQNTLSTMPSPWNIGTSIWMKVVSALNPALWVLWGYWLLFLVVTNGFSRMREVFADKTAIALYGYENFVNGLKTVARNDFIFSTYYIPEMVKLLTKEQKIFTNVFVTMEQNNESSENNKLTEIDKRIFDQEKASVFDSHPLLRERLSYAKYFDVKAKHDDRQDSFKNLFEKWDEVSKAMSDLYASYLSNYLAVASQKPEELEEELEKERLKNLIPWSK